MSSKSAPRVVPCDNLDQAIAHWCDNEGFRLDTIGPADNPSSALLSRGDELIRLTLPGAPTTPTELPANRPEFAHVPASDDWGSGRAAMQYRDVLPNRQGERFIASHIRIPNGGPVPDYVHFHDIRFQMIFCHSGWVDLVYQDQGEPFRLHAGDCVLQPPLIRHRVLTSSDGLEVVEIGCPAHHDTHREHEMELPNGLRPNRDYSGQQFVRSVAADTPWQAASYTGAQLRPTGIGDATDGLADARVIRWDSTGGPSPCVIEPRGEFLFWFIRAGTATLSAPASGDPLPLAPSDAITFVPGQSHTLTERSDDFELLEVALPA